MMSKSVKFKHGTRRPPIEYEKDLVRYWKENKTFQKSVEQRPANQTYVFYDGPPFITGVPHHGTLLSSVVKDAIPRYQTMRGHRVERVWGWDCHGLPAEVYTEQKLGIKDRRDIGTKISLEEYILACRDDMVQTGNLWEETIDRIGRWVDFKGAYKTMDKKYMESVWWAFKELYERGKIYEGEKVLLYCTRDETPLSKAEVSMDNESYRDVTDPSVYVKFKLDSGDKYLLAWTTTPWTLPANTALVVNRDFDYVEVKVGGETLILAEPTLTRVMKDEQNKPIEYSVKRTFKGKELEGKSYEPLFADRGKNAHKIWHADFVHLEEGTGIAHEAPAYGEDDFTLARQNQIPVVLDTDERGIYTEGEWQGRLVWDANKDIAKTLKERGVVWRVEYITHPYPHCHRCGTKLMYRAHPSWFMSIDSQRREMLEQNGPINWFPEHIKQGRFAKTVQSAPDWNLSRDRFWATAMPVWKGVDKSGHEHTKVIGSYAELKDLSGVELEDYHRPWIDDVTFTIDGVQYKRVDKVMDSWFESGSMPFAQYHYPFENREKFESEFPGDFISEYVAQVRAWFYYLHAVSVGIFGKNAFKNVIVTGTIAGNDGRKMSKSYGNYTDPNELMDLYSADALRFHFLSSPVLNGEDLALQDKDVADVARKLTMIWNMYDFFTLYAQVDGWQWDGDSKDPGESTTNPLDQWILSRLHQTIDEMTRRLDGYDTPGALKPVLPFLDDASNWYVRRSRRRFWKSANDEDKQAGYRTLHYLLSKLALALAPFTPFLSDELYRNLTGRESVHLEDWPTSGHVNQSLLDDMAKVRDIISQGLAQRAAAGIKVRQPLAKINIVTPTTLTDFYLEIIKEELNVKMVNQTEGQEVKVKIDVKITTELAEEGLAREAIRRIQNLRKRAGLNVDDHIKLGLNGQASDKLIKDFGELIKAETLADTLDQDAYQHEDTMAEGGVTLSISLDKN